jgi:pyruvate dehydrogenase E2 component (dihydrolipoamide acetyltransferase)
MATLLRVPEVATGSTEAILTEWLVPENVTFAAGAAIAVLETDKAAVEVEAEADAMILRRLVNGGTAVEVGAPIAVLGVAGEDVTALLAELDTLGEAGTAALGSPAGRVFASPLARKLLKEAGIAPAAVTGSGPNGRIVRKDAEAAIAQSRAATRTAPAPPPPVPSASPQPTPPQPTPAQPTPPRPTVPPTAPPLAASPASPGSRRPALAGFAEVPHSRIRHAIATRLTASKQSVPHFYVRRTARIDALLALRTQLNEVSARKISVNDLMIKAVAIAHLAVPEANAIWTDDAMRRYAAVDVGVAIASARGLVTPVLRGVESSSVSAISAQVKAFATQADNGKLMQRDLDGGTITVSNLGMYGVDEFSAIINPPQSAILAVGAGKPSPAVVDGELIVATGLNLVLSVDHRAIDGALAAQWLTALVDAIEHPLRLLA